MSGAAMSRARPEPEPLPALRRGSGGDADDDLLPFRELAAQVLALVRVRQAGYHGNEPRRLGLRDDPDPVAAIRMRIATIAQPEAKRGVRDLERARALADDDPDA